MPSGTAASRRKLSTRAGWDERPNGGELTETTSFTRYAPADSFRRAAVNRMLRQNSQHGPKAGGLLLLLSVLFLAYRQFNVTSSALPAFLLADLPLPVHHELPSINFANHPVSPHRPVRPGAYFVVCVFSDCVWSSAINSSGGDSLINYPSSP